MFRSTVVEPREGYRICLRFSDGAAGVVDLAHLAERGVFEVWNDRANFETDYIAPLGSVAWGQDIELCPDALYMQLTGKPISDFVPGADRLV